MLWGWLPCGLSTTLLAAAWLQASALNGALLMLAFGLGTLPVMLPLTWSGARLGRWLQTRWRHAAAMVVLMAGLMTLTAPWLMQVPALHGAAGRTGLPQPACMNLRDCMLRAERGRSGPARAALGRLVRITAVREARELLDVEYLHAPADHRDHAVVLQSREAAADGLQREPEDNARCPRGSSAT